MTTSTYTVRRGRIEEHVVPGKRLGRNLHHDSRSLAYRYQRSAGGLQPVLHKRNIPILDQLQTSGCTGNAEVGALGTDPLFASLAATARGSLDESGALRLYSAAEVIDGGAGLPSEDDGSSGLSVCQAAKNAGLISGYTHCLSLADVLDALQESAVIIGSYWYDSMDRPDSGGLVTISPDAVVRGAHEYVMRGIDAGSQMVFQDNSWGQSWGDKGSFTYSWATLERLLAEDGDGTVSVPLSRPAPVPVPPPPVPVVADAADLALVQALDPWASARHAGANERAVRDYQDWRSAKGLL